MSKIVLSICIVAYKAHKELDLSLQSIFKYPPSQNYEVIVVDNNEEGNEVQDLLGNKYPTVRYIKPIQNKGYGAGNNTAISVAPGEFALIMNPDTKVFDGTIDAVVRFMRNHKKAAIVGPNFIGSKRKQVQLPTYELTFLKGVFVLSFINKVFPNNFISRSYFINEKQAKKEIKVGAVPGSLFLLRIKAFREVGGFDEKFFLYFEESDLGKRLIKKGWELWVIPNAIASHIWGGSTKSVPDEKIKRIFSESRFYYFKKHYGVLRALIVEMFARFGRMEAVLALLVIAGGFLRVYRLPQNMVFHGELGDNYLAMKNILETGSIPLLGPPTSHPWLYFGPLYYWIFAPILILVHYDPIGMSFVFCVLQTALIFISYIFISKIFNKRTALISSAFIAFSPAYISFTREARFFSLTLILFYPFYYFFVNKKYFLTSLFFAVILNFHLTPIVYIPPIVIYMFLKRREEFKEFAKKSILGLLVGSLPFIVYDATHKFEMLYQVILWIPYRVLGFLGIIPKNTVTGAIVGDNLQSGYYFIKNTFIPSSISDNFSLFLLLALIIIFAFGIKEKLNRDKIMLPLLIFSIGYLAIFIHGSPPSHYYLPLYPVLVLLVSHFISNAQGKMKIYYFSFLAICFLANILFFFLGDWYFKTPSDYKSGMLIPYSSQEEISKNVVRDAAGAKFSVKRVGDFDYFEQNYSQNYRYLMWRNGNEPGMGKTLTYIIYEGIVPPIGEKTIYSKSNIFVTKTYENENK